MKYILFVRNSLDEIKNRLGTTEEKTSEYEESKRNCVMKHRKTEKNMNKNCCYL